MSWGASATPSFHSKALFCGFFCGPKVWPFDVGFPFSFRDPY